MPRSTSVTTGPLPTVAPTAANTSDTARSRESVIASALLLADVAALGVLVDLPVRGLWTIDLRWENATHHWALRHPDVIGLARALAVLGGPVVVNLVVLAATVAALFLAQYRAATAIVGARLGELLTKTALNDIIDRARPVLQPALAHPSGTSFPSGHAAGTTAVVGVGLVLLARARSSGRPAPPRARVPRYAVSALTVAGAALVASIGASRVVLGVHYPSDVLAGVLLGLAWAFAAEAFLARGSPRPTGGTARRSRARTRGNPTPVRASSVGFVEPENPAGPERS